MFVPLQLDVHHVMTSQQRLTASQDTSIAFMHALQATGMLGTQDRPTDALLVLSLAQSTDHHVCLVCLTTYYSLPQ